MNKFEFLTSTRFWAIVIGAVSLALFKDGVIDAAWFAAIGTITTGFTAVRTVDRATETLANKD